MKKFILTILILILSSINGFSQTFPEALQPDLGEYIGKCAVCGAPVYKDMLTRMDLVRQDKSIVHVCGLPCAARYISKHGEATIREIWIIDYYSGRRVSIMGSYYVLGANLRPAGGTFPAIAFDVNYRADYFRLQHGGVVYQPKVVLEMVRSLNEKNNPDLFQNILNPEPGKKIADCPVCGHPVYSGLLTRVDLIGVQDTLHTCSLVCASRLLSEKKYKSVLVVDFPTHTFCDLNKASFVIKSNVLPVRSKWPILAFREKQVAKDFINVHHGKLLNTRQIRELLQKLQPPLNSGE